MSHLNELRRKLDNDKLRRLGAALWFSIDSRLGSSELTWMKPLLGEGVERLLWESLHEAGVLSLDGTVQAKPLARWLEALSSGSMNAEREPRIVWTLPEKYSAAVTLGASYLEAILEVISQAQNELLMVSPFIQKQGIRCLSIALIQALSRGIRLTIITHDADNLASDQSLAIEEIRREADRLGGWLTVYTAAVPEESLLHAKIVVADQQRVIVGSANLTGPGLESNLEAGVVLGHIHAGEVVQFIRRLIDIGLVRKVFSTGANR